METRTITGVVANIEDPKKAGRIQARLTELGGQVCPIWIRPVWMSGWFWIPQLDEEVEIEIPAGEDLIEFAEEMRYRGIAHDENAPFPDSLPGEYKTRRGFVTPQGYGMITESKPGSEFITFLNNGTVMIRGDKDGIFLGLEAAAEPLVLGTALTSVLVSLVDAVLALSVAGVTTGPGVSAGLSPASATLLNNIKTSLNNGGHLSDYIFANKTKPTS